jgi:hypothetical protein
LVTIECADRDWDASAFPDVISVPGEDHETWFRHPTEGTSELLWDNGEIDGPGLTEICSISVRDGPASVTTETDRMDELVALKQLLSPRVAA